MEREKQNYLSNYQKLRFGATANTNNPLEQADIERKCMIQTYSSSRQLLSNEETCALLKNDMRSYSAFMDKSSGAIDEMIASALQNVNAKPCDNWDNFQSGIISVNLEDLLKPLPCANVLNTQCKSPNINKQVDQISKSFKELPKSHFKADLKSFKELPECNFEPDPKVPKIAKRFAPSCCVPRQQENDGNKSANVFRTARDEFVAQNAKKFGRQPSLDGYQTAPSVGGVKRKLGTRRGVQGKFVSPMLSNTDSNEELQSKMEVDDERLKNVDPRMVELIRSEIMDVGTPVEWDDIAGLNFAKTIIKESVVLPLLRPDIFTGLRRPPRGILLFGPPGTGKTLIGKCIASQSKSTFFSISASSLTSKWIGEGEKMVRVLFTVARVHQPAVVFIDEIDSLLTQRSETEHESSRRIKTEFFVQLDGATTDSADRILLIGATNRPQELDEAARRRFEKRLYIPLPESEARLQLVTKLMSRENHTLTDTDVETIAHMSEGFSGADMRQLCSEASMGPIRSIDLSQIERIDIGEVRPINVEDFKNAFARVRASVASKDLDQYVVWNQTYGSGN